MNFFRDLRRRFYAADNEKAAVNFIAEIVGCQIGALIDEAVQPQYLSQAIEHSKTLKAYFIGIAFRANRIYEVGDFEHVLSVLAHLLGHLLNRPSWRNVNFRECLVQSFNSDRKAMDSEFEIGLEMAAVDADFYRSGGYAQFNPGTLQYDDVPNVVRSVGPKLSFYKYVARMRS